MKRLCGSLETMLPSEDTIAIVQASKMRRGLKTKLKGDKSRADASAYFTLPFNWQFSGKAKVPVKVIINGYTWHSTVGNRGGQR